MTDKPVTMADMNQLIGAINQSLSKKKKEEALKHYQSFVSKCTQILQSARTDTQSIKIQITDFLPVIVHRFPTVIDDSINLQFDLIEDENQSIKIRAIKGIEIIGKNNQSSIDRLMDVVLQLYCAIPVIDASQSADQSTSQSAKKSKKSPTQSLTPAQELELTAINHSIKEMFASNAPLCFVALFNQMSECETQSMARLIDCLNTYLPQYRNTLNLSNNETQLKISKHLKAALSNSAIHQSTNQSTDQSANQSVSRTLLDLLLSMKCNKADASFTSDLAQILVNQSINQSKNQSINQAFVDACHNLKMINRSIKPSLNQSVDGKPFVEFFTERICPSLTSKQSTSQMDDQTKLDVLRSFSTLIELIDSSLVASVMSKIWSVAKEHLPVKKSVSQSADQTTTFSISEVLLVCINELASKSKDASAAVLGGSIKQDTIKRMAVLKESVQQWLHSTNQSIESVIEAIKQSKSPETKKQLSDAKTNQAIASSLLRLIDGLIDGKFVTDGACSWRKAKKPVTAQSVNPSTNQPKKQPKEKQQATKQTADQPKENNKSKAATTPASNKKAKQSTPQSENQSTNQPINQSASQKDKKRKNDSEDAEPVAKRPKKSAAAQSKDDAAAAAYAAELESQAKTFYKTGAAHQLNIDNINQSIKQTVNQAKQDKKIKTREHQAARAWRKK